MKRYNVANHDETGYYCSGFDTWHEANDMLSLAKAHDPNAHIVEIEVMTDVERLQEELEKVKRERDAAVRDMMYATRCESCKHYRVDIGDFPCNKCTVVHNGAWIMWEWRGLCEGNGGVEA